MTVRNRLKSYRHNLEFNQTQMAEFLGINFVISGEVVYGFYAEGGSIKAEGKSWN